MSCARICPRGSFLGLVTRPFAFFSLKRPAITYRKGFKFFVWALMMGSFFGLMIWIVPTGDIHRIGFTILVFSGVHSAPWDLPPEIYVAGNADEVRLYLTDSNP